VTLISSGEQARAAATREVPAPGPASLVQARGRAETRAAVAYTAALPGPYRAMSATPPPPALQPHPSLVTLTHVVYALHAVSLVLGAFGAATVIGSFLFGWPSIIGVILNYVKRSEVHGTWLESHFRWQIRTFWYALLWVLVAALVSLPLLLVLVGFLTWPVMLSALGLWAIYRIARGWLTLRDGQPMPLPPG
jgi:uncharacterized membrane protein